MRRSNIDSPAPRRPGLRTLWGRAKSIMKSIRHWLSVRYAVSRGVGTGSRARRGSALYAPYAGGRLASLSVRFPDPRSLCPLASLDCARDGASRPRVRGRVVVALAPRVADIADRQLHRWYDPRTLEQSHR